MRAKEGRGYLMRLRRPSPMCKFALMSSDVKLIPRFNATQKGALAQGIFHRLVAEYLDCVYRFLSPEDANTKMHQLLDA
jgi:hypothetical protein